MPELNSAEKSFCLGVMFAAVMDTHNSSLKLLSTHHLPKPRYRKETFFEISHLSDGYKAYFHKSHGKNITTDTDLLKKEPNSSFINGIKSALNKPLNTVSLNANENLLDHKFGRIFGALLNGLEHPNWEDNLGIGLDEMTRYRLRERDIQATLIILLGQFRENMPLSGDTNGKRLRNTNNSAVLTSRNKRNRPCDTTPPSVAHFSEPQPNGSSPMELHRRLEEMAQGLIANLGQTNPYWYYDPHFELLNHVSANSEHLSSASRFHLMFLVLRMQVTALQAANEGLAKLLRNQPGGNTNDSTTPPTPTNRDGSSTAPFAGSSYGHTLWSTPYQDGTGTLPDGTVSPSDIFGPSPFNLP